MNQNETKVIFINKLDRAGQIKKSQWRSHTFDKLATGHFSGKWMTSDRPSGHTDSEYIIGSALKCPQFECIDGQTY